MKWTGGDDKLLIVLHYTDETSNLEAVTARRGKGSVYFRESGAGTVK